MHMYVHKSVCKEHIAKIESSGKRNGQDAKSSTGNVSLVTSHVLKSFNIDLISMDIYMYMCTYVYVHIHLHIHLHIHIHI